MCLLTSGVSQACAFNPGGLKKLILVNKDDVLSLTKDGSGVVTTVSLAADALQYEFAFVEDSANADQKANAQSFIEQTVKFSIGSNYKTVVGNAKPTDAQAKLMVDVYMQLALGTFVAFPTFRNGKTYALGVENGLKSTETSFSSGASKTDVAGGVISLSGIAEEFAPVVAANVVYDPA